MLKRIVRNRIFLAVLAFVLAGILLLFVQPYLASKINEQKELVRAKVIIFPGKEITADTVEVVKVGAHNIPDTFLTKKEDVIGKYATVTISEKDFFTEDKISLYLPSKEVYLNDLKEGEMAISIPLKEMATGLSGKLQANDIVGLIAVGEENAFQVETLKYVKVLAVSNVDGVDKGSQGIEENQTKKELELKTITLLVSERQAKDLAFHEEHFKVYFTLVYRGKENESEKFLSQQKQILKEVEEREEKEAAEKEELEKKANGSIEPEAVIQVDPAAQTIGQGE